MAIKKSTILKPKRPESLYEIPELDYRNNVDCPCHSDDDIEHKHIELYDSYDEAVIACGRLFLKPGETHTEFYKKDNTYHCVIAIGNINPNKGHLYLEDMSNGENSINDILSSLKTLSEKNQNSITSINKKIKEFSTTLQSQDLSISEIVEQLNINTEDISTLQTNLGNLIKEFNKVQATVSKHVLDVSRLEATDSSLYDMTTSVNASLNSVSSELDTKIEDVSARLTNVVNDLPEGILQKVEDISLKLSTKIAEISTNLAIRLEESTQQMAIDLSTLIDTKITADFADLSTQINQKIDNLSTNIHLDVLNISINTNNRISDLSTIIDSRVDTLSLLVENTSHMVEELDEQVKDISALVKDNIVDIDSKIDVINASVNSALDNLAHYITDPSINSLFNSDIYTVNLCCYTDAGYITIDDNYPTHGDYRTYVATDTVTLTAYRKTGYKFKHWYRNSSQKTWNSSTLSLTFKDGDINVIATTTSDPEAYDDRNRYTAIFSKLHRVISRVELTNKDEAEILTGDHIIVDGLLEQPCYFDDNANIKLTAVPVNTNHEFRYFIINGQRRNTNVYQFTNISEDIDVTAFFEEIRYHIHAESNVPEYGDIETNKPSTVLPGTQVKITAIPEQGYVFTKWVILDKATNTYVDYPIQSLRTKPEISITINADTWLKAIFTAE